MSRKSRFVAGLWIMIFAIPFCIANKVNDTQEQSKMSYMQMEEKITEPEDNIVKVYISPTGECYHMKKTCAGENAIETTLYKNEKRACKKCVH